MTIYGTTERTIRLSEALNHNGYYEEPGYSINEYTEDGEITTSLINESFPLIRYKGNDVMELMKLDDSNRQVRVKSIEGRCRDMPHWKRRFTIQRCIADPRVQGHHVHRQCPIHTAEAGGGDAERSGKWVVSRRMI